MIDDQDPDVCPETTDADLERLLSEIAKGISAEPVSPQLKALAEKLQEALRQRAAMPDDLQTDPPV